MSDGIAPDGIASNGLASDGIVFDGISSDGELCLLTMHYDVLPYYVMSIDDILSNCFCQVLLSFSSQTLRGITNFSSFYCCCLEEPLSAILAPLLREPLTHARFVGLLVLGPTSLYLHLRAFHFLPKKVHRNQIDLVHCNYIYTWILVMILMYNQIADN